MAFLNLLYDIPRTVRRLLSPNNKKRSREQATENIEVESLPNSKRQATTTRFEEPKQPQLTLLAPKNNIPATTPVRTPKVTYTWGKFAPHSVHRYRSNGSRSDAMMPKKSIAPPAASRLPVEEDAKGLELYKAGVEAHRILEAQRYQRAPELPPSKAFSKAQTAVPAAAGGVAAVESQQAAAAIAAPKTQQADKFRDIILQFTNDVRSKFTSKGASSSLTIPESLYQYGVDGGVASIEAGRQLANEKYTQQLNALKSRMDMARKVVDETHSFWEKDKKTEEELKELEGNMSRMKALRLGKPEQEEEEELRVPLPLLTEADYQEYERLIRQPGKLVLADHSTSNIEIKGHDMATLAPTTWLNDEVINVCMSMLQERDKRYREEKKGTPTCHFFNSFFLNKLYKDAKTYNYSEVQRWTRPPKLKRAGQPSTSILDCDRIIIPANQGNLHWVCAVIDLKNEKFIMYDSLGGNDNACLDHLARYVKDEFKDKKKEDREDVLNWPREFPKDIPMQKNGSDCGMFTIMFADYASQCAVMDFTQANIQDFRVRVVRDIMRLKID